MPEMQPLLFPEVPQPEELIDALYDDAEFRECAIQAARDGEVDGYNDLIGGFRRKSHRGSRAEEQTLQYLGQRLTPIGFEWEEVTNQARFLCADRFGNPVRLIHCRGEMLLGVDDKPFFRIGKKGERTEELVDENQSQLELFQHLATTVGTLQEPIEDLVYNVWLIVDANVKGQISIYLAHATELHSNWRQGGADKYKMNLICPHVRLLWAGSLLEQKPKVDDRPEAAPTEEQFLEERSEESAA
jgi:hypothetical protein